MKTASVFSDDMVLQRNKPVRVFGTGRENERISVSILGNTAFAHVKDGKWEVVLPPMKETDSCTMEIKSENEEIIFKNIAVGEVWLAGGQSNMEFELQNDKNGANALKTCGDEKSDIITRTNARCLTKIYLNRKNILSGKKLPPKIQKTGLPWDIILQGN